jgi:hypothetical protein
MLDGVHDELWKDTKLIIVNEISFINIEDFKTMNRKLSAIKESALQHRGGSNIMFSGDLRQLTILSRSAVNK